MELLSVPDCPFFLFNSTDIIIIIESVPIYFLKFSFEDFLRCF